MRETQRACSINAAPTLSASLRRKITSCLTSIARSACRSRCAHGHISTKKTISSISIHSATAATKQRAVRQRPSQHHETHARHTWESMGHDSCRAGPRICYCCSHHAGRNFYFVAKPQLGPWANYLVSLEMDHQIRGLWGGRGFLK